MSKHYSFFYEVWVCILMLEFSFASLEHLLKKNATKVVPGFLLKLLGKKWKYRDNACSTEWETEKPLLKILSAI